MFPEDEALSEQERQTLQTILEVRFNLIMNSLQTLWITDLSKGGLEFHMPNPLANHTTLVRTLVNLVRIGKYAKEKEETFLEEVAKSGLLSKAEDLFREVMQRLQIDGSHAPLLDSLNTLFWEHFVFHFMSKHDF